MSQDIILDTPLRQTKKPGLVVVPDTWRQLCLFAGRVFIHSAHHQLCEAGRGGRDLRVQPSQLDDPFLLVVCGLDRRRRHPVDHADRHSAGLRRVGRGLAVESYRLLRGFLDLNNNTPVPM